MKVGDLIKYSDDCNDRLGTHGLIVDVGFTGSGVEIEPPIVSILWETGEIEDVFEDELSLVQESIKVIISY
jgi:hypothetical protein